MLAYIYMLPCGDKSVQFHLSVYVSISTLFPFLSFSFSLLIFYPIMNIDQTFDSIFNHSKARQPLQDSFLFSKLTFLIIRYFSRLIKSRIFFFRKKRNLLIRHILFSFCFLKFHFHFFFFFFFLFFFLHIISQFNHRFHSTFYTLAQLSTPKELLDTSYCND